MSGLAHKLLQKDELLDNQLRDRVMEHLIQNPGSYLGKISRELNIPTSTLKYHLNILRSFEMVSTVKKGRCRHFFPRRRRFSDEEKSMYAAIEHLPTRRMVEIVYRNPGISQAGLVQTTGLSQSTVAWHMAKLERLGLLQSERNEVKEYHVVPQFAAILGSLGPGAPGAEISPPAGAFSPIAARPTAPDTPVSADSWIRETRDRETGPGQVQNELPTPFAATEESAAARLPPAVPWRRAGLYGKDSHEAIPSEPDAEEARNASPEGAYGIGRETDARPSREPQPLPRVRWPILPRDEETGLAEDDASPASG